MGPYQPASLVWQIVNNARWPPICADVAGHLLDRPSMTTPTQIATPIPTASQSGSEVADYRATPTPTPSAVAAPYVVPLLRFFPSTGLSPLLSLSMCSLLSTVGSGEPITIDNTPIGSP